MCATLAAALILASHHFATFKYNNFNPGVAAQCDHIETGVYYNSERHLSEYIAYRGDWWKAGIVHGYNRAAIEPAVTVYKDFDNLEVNVVPFIETQNGKFKDIAVVVNAALRWEFR